jgi:hypothetical protein
MATLTLHDGTVLTFSAVEDRIFDYVATDSEGRVAVVKKADVAEYLRDWTPAEIARHRSMSAPGGKSRRPCWMAMFDHRIRSGDPPEHAMWAAGDWSKRAGRRRRCPAVDLCEHQRCKAAQI